MNTLRSSHKHFNLTKSPLYLVKLKIAQNCRPLTAVRSVEPIVNLTFAESRSVCRFFPSLLQNSFSSLSGRKCFTFPWIFIRNLSSNSIWLILACELKLNCCDLWRVTVMTSSSNQVSKLHGVVKCSFLFPLVQEL